MRLRLLPLCSLSSSPCIDISLSHCTAMHPFPSVTNCSVSSTDCTRLALGSTFLGRVLRAPAPSSLPTCLSQGFHPRVALRRYPPPSCGACPGRALRRYALLRGGLTRRAGRRVKKCERAVAASGDTGGRTARVGARKCRLFFLSVRAAHSGTRARFSSGYCKTQKRPGRSSTGAPGREGPRAVRGRPTRARDSFS